MIVYNEDKMNRALIFAGGKGTRMHIGDKPKQFLEIDNKAIIIYTLEKFQECDLVDDIVVVCVGGWESYLQNLIDNNDIKLNKVSKILTGGETGFDSRMIGLEYLNLTKESNDDIVLIHDGVRPFISKELITENINCAKKNKNAITVIKAIETVIVANAEMDEILNRNDCYYARAPQTFNIGDIYSFYLKAKNDCRTDMIDCATIAQYCGAKLNYVFGSSENIKITTDIDFFAAIGLLDNKEKY